MSTTTTTTSTKPRILCLHGKYQSGASFSNKIAGARRKLARVYDLDFLNGPIPLESGDEEEEAFAWWHKDEQGRHSRVQEGLEYVLEYIESQPQHSQPYVALVGFSQGGVVATALACSGRLPSSIQAVVTAGSPFVPEAFAVADKWKAASTATEREIPKLHLAGETDTMVPVESTRQLCEHGSTGRLIIHEQGHLFPTRAAMVAQVLEFLELHIQPNDSEEDPVHVQPPPPIQQQFSNK